jgi:hypothetical protein
MYHTTSAQRTHDEIIIDMLREGWTHSADLVSRSQTRNLQARIAALEGAGWVIDRRPSTDHRDGKEYRAVRFDANKKRRGPKQLHVKIPEGAPAQIIEAARRAALSVFEEWQKPKENDGFLDFSFLYADDDND